MDPDLPVICLITAPEPDGEPIARALVERGLAAGVNVLAARSVYRWRGRVERAAEALLVVYTRAERVGALDEALSELHPYEVWELVALPVSDGSAAFLAWAAALGEEPRR